MKLMFALACALVSFVLILSSNDAGEQKDQKPDTSKDVKKADTPETAKPKYTIKQVMQKGQGKKGLYQKVVDGTASSDDKTQLVEMFVSMSVQTPKKGTPESWKEKTTALVDAAKAVAKGDTGAMETLKQANNCNACHKSHR